MNQKRKITDKMNFNNIKHFCSLKYTITVDIVYAFAKTHRKL